MIDLKIQRAEWTTEAARFLSPSLKRTPMIAITDYQNALESDPVNCGLYRITQNGAPVLYCIVRVEHYSHGAEGVILAAGGRSKLDLTENCLALVEKMFHGVSGFRVTTARRGLIRKLERQGYTVTHYVLKKAAK